MKLNRIIMATACLLMVCGCEDDAQKSTSNPCDEITCNGHGVCKSGGSSPTCDCDDGYHEEISDDGTPLCREDQEENACADINCGGHGKGECKDDNEKLVAEITQRILMQLGK